MRDRQPRPPRGAARRQLSGQDGAVRPIDLLDECRDARCVVEVLQARGVQAQALLAVAVAPGVGLGLATDDYVWAVPCDDDVATDTVAAIEQKLHPRWVWWSAGTSSAAVH